MAKNNSTRKRTVADLISELNRLPLDAVIMVMETIDIEDTGEHHQQPQCEIDVDYNAATNTVLIW